MDPGVWLEGQAPSGERSADGLWTYVDHRFRLELEDGQTVRIVLRVTAEDAMRGDWRVEDAHFAATAWAGFSALLQAAAEAAERPEPQEIDAEWPQGVEPRLWSPPA